MIQSVSLLAATSVIGVVGLGLGLAAAPIGVGVSYFQASKKEDKFKQATILVRQVID